ncbi:helix-turn-helix domain-containing protein [Paenisporosarcina quisquiliarum]|uniref:helix-turn-helix domain-containing protein n=1 Tax=Paenisporosarcina quisquiliarum TaxID=365346 RepID=UPI00373691F8
MNNIGLLIKMSRIQQNMKQVTLAKGICSTSYLSKIENNQTVPSEDVIKLLIDRLGIDYWSISLEEENQFMNQLLSFYKKSIIERNKNHIGEEIPKLFNKNLLFKNERNFYTYNLILYRLILILNPNDERCLALQNTLKHMEDKFDGRQKFLYYFNSGIYYYIQRNFVEALSYFESALNLIASFQIDEWELADFYNALSLSYLSEGKITNTIEYASKSLALFRNNLLFRRALDSYMIVGIAHKKNSNFKYAEESFLLAQKIVNDLNLQDQHGIILHNLGSLAAIQGESVKAIRYFEDSLLNFANDKENYLVSVLYIIMEFSKNNDYEKVIEWCLKGLKIINENSSTATEPFYHHFNLYLALLDHINYEEPMISAVNFFEENKDYIYAHKYSVALGNKYTEKRKYKNASQYFQKANCFLYKIKTIQFWEDL